MSWWLTRSSRLASEKTAIAQLEDTSEWLTLLKWRATNDLTMCLDFVINHDGTEYALEMNYPNVFPDAPPMIFSSDRSRISDHQYGAAGELCLEHRPDNWHPSVTGADMISSAYRLLSEEHPEGGAVVHAHSAHVGSLGRDMRSKLCRFVLSDADKSALNDLTEHEVTKFNLKERTVAKVYIASIETIGPKDAPLWRTDIAASPGGSSWDSLVVRVPSFETSNTLSADGLAKVFALLGLTELQGVTDVASDAARVLIGDADEWQLLWFFTSKDERKIIRYSTLEIPPDMQRLPAVYENLSGKRVGLVGCGSVGSKVAVSLARSGVQNFFLIDEDVFFPGNIVRNELALDGVGVHKANLLKDRLLQISPSVDVKLLRLSLGGQESAASMAAALEELQNCDVIVDATADPVAFNMIASVAKRSKTAMIWCQVFAGGIGGFIARARPDIDPIPTAARDQIRQWCTDQGVAWTGGQGVDARDYEGRAEDGAPLVADDAEVSIVAYHATRFVTDYLTQPDRSIFPMSAYMIGMSSEWAFNQPFDTGPIDLRPEGDWGDVVDRIDTDEMVALLKEHVVIEEADDASSSS